MLSQNHFLPQTSDEVYVNKSSFLFVWIQLTFFVCVVFYFVILNEWSQPCIAPLSFLVTALEQFFQRSLEMSYQIYAVEYGRKWTVWQVSCCLAAPICIFLPYSRGEVTEETTSQGRGIQCKILTNLLSCIHVSMPLFYLILSDIPYIAISGEVLG